MTDLIHHLDKSEAEIFKRADELIAGSLAFQHTNSTLAKAALCIRTLGGFRVWRAGGELPATAWTREKAIHLIQLFVTLRRQYLHKEQIIDRLWPELDQDKGDRDFKVALNAVNKALEPDRPPRVEPRFVQRHGLAYGLDLTDVWLDTEAFEELITIGNQLLQNATINEKAAEALTQQGIACYQTAVSLYIGDYLPERRYEDWTSAERERLQVLALGAMTTLAQLLLAQTPLESIRLTQRVLTIDPVWEDAYRVQMQAYAAQGNRPLALRTYEQCVQKLEEEFEIEPLPETMELYEQIQRQG